MIEMLVVIAVSAVGLLLPAVQSIR